MKARFVLITLTVFISILAGSFHSSLAVEEIGDKKTTELLTVTSASPFGGAAEYDSGWIEIAQDETKTLEHNLGGNPDNYVVDLQGINVGNVVHQLFYGGDTYQTPTDLSPSYFGFMWQKLTDTSIQVSRLRNDNSGLKVRVRIWVVTKNDYDSGWQPIAAKETLKFEHHVAGNPDEYVVDLQFKTSGNFGVHNRSYGLDTYYQKTGGQEIFSEKGAYWYNLNANSIDVYRGEHELYINSIRVRIWRIPSAHYDSGWQDIDQGGQHIFSHNLGGPWNDYFIFLQFKHKGMFNIHQVYYGSDTDDFAGLHFSHGAWLAGVDNSQLIVRRGVDDVLADQVRVRVWANAAPKYDSGWQSIGKGSVNTLIHNLGGDSDNYVVDLQFKDTDEDGSSVFGVNQKNFGGDYYWYQPSISMQYKGIYWRDLTNNQIEVVRLAQDSNANEVRVRIWIPPRSSYQSGWTSITADGIGKDFNHSLGGTTDDYVVYLQSKGPAASGLGVNQHEYGWNYYRTNSTSDKWTGVAWSNLEDDSISVIRALHDTTAEEVRLRIWKNPKPDYDSKWTSINTGIVKEFVHELGGNPDDYVVDLQFMDDIFYDVNQIYYGGNLSYETNGTPFAEGVYWNSLNNSTVKVQREERDSFADQVRVRIWAAGNTTGNCTYLPMIFSSN